MPPSLGRRAVSPTYPPDPRNLNRHERIPTPIVLVIAGSDSSGGAGIQADIRTLSALGVYGATAITAVTAQNTTGVKSILPIPTEMVRAQIDAVAEDLPLQAVKTGMLPHAGCVQVVAEAIQRWQAPNLVVDPVMVAKGGATLTPSSACREIIKRLLPMATVFTPNIPEAEALLGRALLVEEDYVQACFDLAALGPRYVVLKGGHRPGPPVDLLCDGQRIWEFPSQRLASPHTHGTGCTFASAIAGCLALGMEPPEAVLAAKDFVVAAIRHALPIGHGHGPVWQMGERLG